jgi:hypothetical protein
VRHGRKPPKPIWVWFYLGVSLYWLAVAFYDLATGYNKPVFGVLNPVSYYGFWAAFWLGLTLVQEKTHKTQMQTWHIREDTFKIIERMTKGHDA